MDKTRVDAIWVGSGLGLIITSTIMLIIPAWLDRGHRIGALWVGSDGRPSTSKLQFYIWTAVALFGYILLYVVHAMTRHDYHALGGGLPSSLLTAMGMSTLTLVAAKEITASQVANGKVDKGLDVGAPPAGRKGGLLTDDDGRPDLAKIQLLAWTLVALGIYVAQLYGEQVWREQPALPDLDGSLAVLMGFGHAAYLGKKLITTDTPRIASVSAARVRPGMSVTLTGGGFGNATSAQITFDGVAAAVTSTAWSDTQVTFAFPSIQPSGKPWESGKTVQIGLAANGLTSANEVPVSVFSSPQLAQLSLGAAKPGASITIAGDLFDPPGHVLIDGLPVAAESWSAKAVTFKIPDRHPDGGAWSKDQDVQVNLQSDGATGATPLVLKVL